MNFKDYAVESRRLIEKNLSDFLDAKDKDGIPQEFSGLELTRRIKEFSTKGKLLRGALFLFACEMFGEKISDFHIDVASAIELMHSGLLIHDDIIDNDLKRRGAKTIFAQYIDRGNDKKIKNPSFYGMSMGIVAGDIAFFLGMNLISRAGHKAAVSVSSFFSHELYLVALAEAADSEYGQSDEESSDEQINNVYKFKTARYTFSTPLVLAGIIADKDKNTLQTVEKIGELLGVIFQIKDDEMGLFGDEDSIGKPVGGDIRENKKTLIRSLLFRKAQDNDREILSGIFGNKDLTKEQVEEVKTIAEKYEVKKEMQKDLEGNINETRRLIRELNVEEKYKKVLNEVLEYNLKRTY